MKVSYAAMGKREGSSPTGRILIPSSIARSLPTYAEFDLEVTKTGFTLTYVGSREKAARSEKNETTALPFVT